MNLIKTEKVGINLKQKMPFVKRTAFVSAESEGVEPMLSIACPIRDLFLKVANAPNNAPDKT